MKKYYILILLLIFFVPTKANASGNIVISRGNKSLIIYSNNSKLGNVSRTIRTFNVDNGVSYHISSNMLSPGDDKAPKSYYISSTRTPDLKQIGIIQYGKSKGYSDLAIQIALYLDASWNDKADDVFFDFPLALYLSGKDPVGSGIDQINDSSGEVKKAFEIFFNSSEITLKSSRTGYSSAVYNFECENGICYYPSKNKSVTVASLTKLGIPKDAIIKDIIVDEGTTISGNYKNVKASEASISFTKKANMTICANCASSKISIEYDHPSNVSIPELALPNSGEGISIINSSNMLVYKNATISTKTFTIFSGETSTLANETFNRLYSCDINLIVEGGVSSPNDAEFKKKTLQDNLDDEKLAIDYSKIIGQKACNNQSYMVESSEATSGNTFSNNRYCRIQCKEDVQINIPNKVIAPSNSGGVVFSGRYFTLQDLEMESKKTCISTMTDENGNPTSEPGINLALFYKDVYGYEWKEGDPIPTAEDLNAFRTSSTGGRGGIGSHIEPRGYNSNHALQSCITAVLGEVKKILKDPKARLQRIMEAADKDGAERGCVVEREWIYNRDLGEYISYCSKYGWVDKMTKKVISIDYDYYEGEITAGDYQEVVKEAAESAGIQSNLCGIHAASRLNFPGIHDDIGATTLMTTDDKDYTIIISLNVLISASSSVSSDNVDPYPAGSGHKPGGSSSYQGEDLIKYLIDSDRSDSDFTTISSTIDESANPDTMTFMGDKIPSGNTNFLWELYSKGKFAAVVTGVDSSTKETLDKSKVLVKETEESIEQLLECSTFFKYIDYNYKPEISFKYCDEYDVDYVMEGQINDEIKLEFCKSTPFIVDYECPEKDKIILKVSKKAIEGMSKTEILNYLKTIKSETSLEYADILKSVKYYNCGSNGCSDASDIVNAIIPINLGSKTEYTAKWTANSVTKYYSVLPTGVARTIPIAGRSVLLGTDGVVFPINITDKKKSCEYSFDIKNLGERKFEQCFPELQNAYTCHFDIENEIVKPCETCDTNGIQFFYRPISLNNVFPNSEGKASYKNYRTVGSNWSDNKGTETIKEIESEKDSIYADIGDGGNGPEYSYTITPIQAYHIRAYNEEAENLNLGYADFNMTCDEYGKQCRSKWLDGQMGSCGGNANCGQYYFTDNLTIMPDDLSTRSVYFCTWQDGTSWKGATQYETCPYIDGAYEELEASND